MLEKLEGVKPDEAGEFTLLWNRYELNRQDWGIDLKQHSERMIEALKERGIGVSAEEMPNGYGWGAWRQQAGEVLEAFFPM